jgi:HAD superfamily hydrolase (TIGR01509 family)
VALSSEGLSPEALAAGRAANAATAVILDVDGTLVDTRAAHLAAWQEAFARFGKQFDPERLSMLFGSSAQHYLDVLLSDDERARFGADVLRAKHAAFRRRMADLPPLPGAREILRDLQRAGKRLALASGALRAELDHYLSLLGDDGVVSASVSLDDVARGKPDPETFLTALRALSAQPREAVVVGDSVVDCQAAAAAGIACIGVLTGGFSADDLNAAGARAVCLDIAEVRRGYLAAIRARTPEGES